MSIEFSDEAVAAQWKDGGVCAPEDFIGFTRSDRKEVKPT